MTAARVPEQDAEALSKGEMTRRAILDAAIVRFGRDGFRATSVADIARDASVGGTVTYTYFPNKDALFVAAVDEDAAGVIREGVLRLIEGDWNGAWAADLLVALVEAVDAHPLARRLLAGQEPEVTDRVLEIPALTELRQVCGERLAADQEAGLVRADLDAVVMANGLVSIVLSLLMSIVHLGGASSIPYTTDVIAVLEAAVGRTTPAN